MRLLVCCVLAFAACTAHASQNAVGWVALRAPFAYDGDTIYATAAGLPPELAEISIRVRGVDTPEIRGHCAGEKAMAIEARDFVRAALGNGDTVSFANIEWDKYGGRILATVYVDGQDLSALIIDHGLGRAYDGGQRQSWC